MTDKIIKISLLATFLVCFITYSFWSVIKETLGIRIFYPGIALAFVGYTYVIHLLICERYFNNKKHRFVLFLSRVVFLSTVNNLIDEVFFNPLAINYNEYIGFLLILIFAYNKYYKKWMK